MRNGCAAAAAWLLAHQPKAYAKVMPYTSRVVVCRRRSSSAAGGGRGESASSATISSQCAVAPHQSLSKEGLDICRVFTRSPGRGGRSSSSAPQAARPAVASTELARH